MTKIIERTYTNVTSGIVTDDTNDKVYFAVTGFIGSGVVQIESNSIADADTWAPLHVIESTGAVVLDYVPGVNLRARVIFSKYGKQPNNSDTDPCVCTVTASGTYTPPKATKINIYNPPETVEVGSDAEAPTWDVEPYNVGVDQTVAWSSSDETKATVVEATGVVTGVAAGSATITATHDSGVTAEYDITVTGAAPPPPPEGEPDPEPVPEPDGETKAKPKQRRRRKKKED